MSEFVRIFRIVSPRPKILFNKGWVGDSQTGVTSLVSLGNLATRKLNSIYGFSGLGSGVGSGGLMGVSAARMAFCTVGL
jgi:hypothetical protein